MTSPLATNAVILPKNSKTHYLYADKNQMPLYGQVPIITETYFEQGDETIVPTGSSQFIVAQPLVGDLTLDYSERFNFAGKHQRILLLPNSVNDVVLHFSNAVGYTVYVSGGGAVVGDYTITASANLKSVNVLFTEYFAFIINE